MSLKHHFWLKYYLGGILDKIRPNSTSSRTLNLSLISRILIWDLNSIKFELEFVLEFRLFLTFFESNSKFVRAYLKRLKLSKQNIYHFSKIVFYVRNIRLLENRIRDLSANIQTGVGFNIL